MAHRGLRFVFIVILMAALPAAAQQQPQDGRIEKLEQQLDELTQQILAIRAELAQLKGAQPASPAPAQDLTAVTLPEQDLTAVSVENAPPAEPAATPAPSPSELTEVATVNNAPSPGAAKVFNPDISVVANIVGKAGQQNPFEYGEDGQRSPIGLEESEVAFQAFIDPYAKGAIFLAIGEEGIEVEEGYAQFIALPWDLTAKAGRFKSQFGKANTWHTHIRPWIDQPLMVHNFFGDEQLHDDGISVSKLIASRLGAAEITGEVTAGNVENVFERTSHNDLLYNAHAKLFRDINENSNVEMGASYARGTIAGGHNQFTGVDLTYRWRPLQQGLYKSMIVRAEGLINDRADAEKNLHGFYLSLDRQIARRWFAGVRLDRADRITDDGIGADKGVSGTLTFWPSEFSQFRTQLRRTRYGSADPVNELLFQLQFAIGAHGAHSF